MNESNNSYSQTYTIPYDWLLRVDLGTWYTASSGADASLNGSTFVSLPWTQWGSNWRIAPVRKGDVLSLSKTSKYAWYSFQYDSF